MTHRTTIALAAAAPLVSIGGTAHAGPPWTVLIGGSSTGAPASFTTATEGAHPNIGFNVPETAQQFAVSGGGLTISNVSGCYGLFVDGDPMTFEATYQLANIAN